MMYSKCVNCSLTVSSAPVGNILFCQVLVKLSYNTQISTKVTKYTHLLNTFKHNQIILPMLCSYSVV